MKEYYLCSEAVVKAFPEAEKSKPFKSGYIFDSEENYYIAVLDFEKVLKYYQTNEPSNFECHEIVDSHMNVNNFPLELLNSSNVFSILEIHLSISKLNNRAYAFYKLSEIQSLNPIEFINSLKR